MRIVDLSEGMREGVLRRRPMERMELPQRVVASIAEFFGQPLSADEVVDRIIAAVRDDGDGALLRFSAAFDRVVPNGLEGTHQEIEAA